MAPLSPDLRRRIVAAVEAGESIRSVAARFDVGLNTVCRLLKRLREHGTLDPRPHGGGREPYLRPDDMEALKRLVADDPDATLDQLRRRGGWDCSLTTIWRALEALDLTLKVKDLHADERGGAEVQARRESHRRSMRSFGARRLIFLDEAGVDTSMTPSRARAPRGERAHGSAPGRWESTTVVAAIGVDGVLAPMTLPGAMNGATFEAYVEGVLAPELEPGDVVVMDNLASHKSGRVIEAIEAVGARVKFLPPYSPDLNPIEKTWSKVKEFMRRAEARTRAAVISAVGDALRSVMIADIHGWFRSVGLSPTRS